MKKYLSVVLATHNEESNLKDCLASIKDIASEIVVVDGESTDKTVEIAKSFKARVIEEKNHPVFHINKQKAIDEAQNEWVLQLDADERVSKKLADEIGKVIGMTDEELNDYQMNLIEGKLFQKHIQVLEKRDGPIGKKEGEFVAFFIPRLNFFLGRYLKHGGVYPDGVIRLIKKGKAYLPAKDVHEQMVVNGRVGWLFQPLYHKDSPTFSRYLKRNSRYIDLLAKDLPAMHDTKGITGLIRYLFLYPTSWFIATYLLKRGFLDSYQGFLFSLFSSLRFPRAYLRWKMVK